MDLARIFNITFNILCKHLLQASPNTKRFNILHAFFILRSILLLQLLQYGCRKYSASICFVIFTKYHLGNPNGRRGEGPQKSESDCGAFPYSRSWSSPRYLRTTSFIRGLGRTGEGKKGRRDHFANGEGREDCWESCSNCWASKVRRNKLICYGTLGLL